MAKAKKCTCTCTQCDKCRKTIKSLKDENKVLTAELKTIRKECQKVIGSVIEEAFITGYEEALIEIDEKAAAMDAFLEKSINQFEKDYEKKMAAKCSVKKPSKKPAKKSQKKPAKKAVKKSAKKAKPKSQK